MCRFILLSLLALLPAIAAAQSVDQLYAQADSLYRSGDFSRAAVLFGDAAEYGSSDDRARFLFLAAKAWYRAGEHSTARDHFQELLRRKPPAYVEATSHFYLGNLEFEGGNQLDAAYEYLDAWRTDYNDTRREIYVEALRPLLEFRLSAVESEQLYQAAGDRELQRQLFCALAERYQNEGRCQELLDRIDDYLAAAEDSPCAQRLAQLQRYCRLGLLSAARFAVLAPRTGPLGAYGESLIEGATLALENYRDRSGVAIDMLVKDSEGTAIGAAIAAGELDGEPLSAILGPLSSNETPSVVAKASCAGVPVLSPTASSGRLTEIDDNFFQMTPSMTNLSKALAEFTAQDLRLDSVALIYPDDIDGRRAANAFLDIARRSGVQVFFSRSFSPAAADFRDLLIDLKVQVLPQEFDPDLYIDKYGDTLETEAVPVTVPAICVPATQAQLELLIPQINFYKIQTTFLGGDTWGAERVLRMSELKTREVFFADNFFVLPADREYNYFYNQYHDRFGHAPDEVAAQGYDAARLLIQAISNAGPEPGKVQSYLESAVLDGALAGRIKIGPDHENEAVHIYRALAGEVQRAK